MRETLCQGLPAMGISEACMEPLLSFADLLLKKNEVMNLTAITDPKDVAALHLLDSLTLLAAADFANKRLIDVGTGAGFPGLPIAIACPDCQVTLLDSLGKRVDFLQEVCAALSLSNVTCVHGRAEEYVQSCREQYDIAASRAVAELRTLSELCLPYVRPGGLFLAMKSVDTEGELAAAQPAIRLLGAQTERIIDCPLPSTEITHRLIVLRKRTPTPPKYPRRFAVIKKQPL